MADGEFNVVQFFRDGSCEYIRRNADAREAVEIAARATKTLGARLGFTVKVIITDADDFTNFLWEDGVVVYPLEAAGKVAK